MALDYCFNHSRSKSVRKWFFLLLLFQVVLACTSDREDLDNIADIPRPDPVEEPPAVPETLEVTGLADDSFPTQSKTWTWGCSGATSCEYRYVVNTSSSHTFTTEPYGTDTTTTQNSGTNLYYLHVQARDAAETTEESTVVSVQAIVDNTPPSDLATITLVTPSSSPGNVTTPTMQVAGVEPASTVNVYTDPLCVTQVATGTPSNITIDLTTSALTDGSYQFYSDTTDFAGNASGCSGALLSYDLDTDIPVLSLSSPTDITSANVGSYSVSGSCSEEGLNVNVDFNSFTNNDVTCTSGSFFVTGVSLVGASDAGSFVITATQTDAAGNLGTGTATVVKDTTTNLVAITSADNIDQANVTSYSVSGTCSENGVMVDVFVGTINVQPLCSGGTWDSGVINASSLGEGAVSITADHGTATQASTSVTKDTASPTVTITSALNINSSNESSYSLSGTCSENGVAVSVSVGGVLQSPTCGSGTWSATGLDVSGLGDGAVSITADHSTATQASTSVTKNTVGPSLTDFAVALTYVDNIELSWGVTGAGGFTLEDYEVQFRVTGTTPWISFSDGVSTNLTATVTGLTADTSYDFRGRAIYDTGTQGAWSETATGITKPNSPLFTSANAVMNVGGATSTSVVAYYDNTNVTLDGVAIAGSPLSAGQTAVIATTQFQTIDSDRPIFVAGNRGGSVGDAQKANVVWMPLAWSGKSFSFNATRSNPQILSVFAAEDATVTVLQGGGTLASTTITAGNGTTLTWSTYGSYQVISTGTILAYHHSEGGSGNDLVDPKPLMPSFTKIIGFPSGSMRLTTELDGTNYSYLHSNSNSNSGSLGAADVITLNAQGTSSLYRSESLVISADKGISGASFADSNGSCAAPFLPTNLLRSRYAINVSSDYVAFASLAAGSIDVYTAGQDIGVDPPSQTLTLTQSGGDSNAPFVVRMGAAAAGTRYVATTPVAAWYHPDTDTGAADNDETILYGTNEE